MKKVFRQYYREGIFEEIATDVIRSTAEECRQNGHLYFTINTADALFADKEKLCIYILQ